MSERASRFVLVMNGFGCGIALMAFDNFFEGPCPDRYAELASHSFLPQPWFFGAIFLWGIILAVLGVRRI